MFSLRCICRCRNQLVVGSLGLKCYGSSATRQTASRFSTFVGIASAYVHLESRSFGSANVGAMTSMPGPFRPRTGTEEPHDRCGDSNDRAHRLDPQHAVIPSPLPCYV